MVAVLTVVGLLALQLAVANLAARSTALLPLIWVVAMAPAAIGVWILFAPEGVERLRLARAA